MRCHPPQNSGLLFFVNGAYISITWCLDFINGAYSIVNAAPFFKIVTVVFINGAYLFVNVAPISYHSWVFSPKWC